MSEMKRILIVGGGYAGLSAAKFLHKKYKRQKAVRITLVDRNRFHTLMTELHEVAGDRVPQESVKVSYDRIFSGTNVNVVFDEVVEVDFEEKRAIGKIGEYRWERILFAYGGVPADFNIAGVRDNTFSLWSIDDALLIKNHLETIYRRAALESDERVRRELMRVVVAGGGFTGVELIGELVEYLPVLCERYALPRKDARLINLEAMGDILQIFPDALRAKARAYMEKKGVEVRVNALVTRATPTAFHMKSGEIIKAGTKVWTCGVRGNCFTDSPALKEGKAGRKEVDDFMRCSGHEDAYMAGDGIWFLEDGKPIPQTVEAAEQTAKTAAYNISVDIDRMLCRKAGSYRRYRGKYHGYMVSIGSKFAFSHTGGIAMAGFFAMAMKHVVNLYYLYTLAGFNALWDYLKHEILDIRHGRSLIGSFLVWKTPAYWLFPLRVFVGVQWLIQGLEKISGAWLDRSNDFVSVAGAGADAVTAATDAAANAGAAAEYGSTLLSEPWGPYTWIAQWTVNRAPFFFQAGIVVFEILIGLALVGGAFTWLSAAASFLFCIILIVGAMADSSIFWYMFAALALMGGAGRIFGLDYWIIPFVKKWWNGTRLARRTHLYLGEPKTKMRIGAAGLPRKLGNVDE